MDEWIFVLAATFIALEPCLKDNISAPYIEWGYDSRRTYMKPCSRASSDEVFHHVLRPSATLCPSLGSSSHSDEVIDPVEVLLFASPYGSVLRNVIVYAAMVARVNFTQPFDLIVFQKEVIFNS
tara:strand:+ start:908 stop:1279 length:372 start_codon:yes stop_codon:yes gene_type:complete